MADTTQTAGGAHSTARYTGIVTESAAQYGQEVVLRYAHKSATNEDVARMVILLRRTADQLARGLP